MRYSIGTQDPMASLQERVGRLEREACRWRWTATMSLEREPGGTTMPHYHVPTEELPPLPTRHQILLCQRGRARIGIFTKEGRPLGDVILTAHDLVLMLEGHEVEFLEPKTRLIEIKQGPFPGTDADDKVDLPPARP
jgi:hypothetical protein